MERREAQARCNADPPDLTQPAHVLRYLLRVEFRRLQVAERIERERDIVFPETTVIIRDIQKLQDRIAEMEGSGEQPHHAATDRQDDRQLSELLRSVSEASSDGE